MRKILTVLLAVIMLVSVMTGCSTSKNDISVTVSFTAGDEVIFNRTVIVDGENATVIDAVKEAMGQYNVNVVLNSNGYTVQSVNEYAACTKNDGERDLKFGWLYTLNGQEPTGFANAVTIADGDKIAYVFTYSYDNNGKYTTEEYDSEMNMFGEYGDEETEPQDTDEAE